MTTFSIFIISSKFTLQPTLSRIEHKVNLTKELKNQPTYRDSASLNHKD